MDRPRPASKPFPKLAAAVALLALLAAGVGAWRFLADGGGRDNGTSDPRLDARRDAATAATESAADAGDAYGPSREADAIARDAASLADSADAVSKYGIMVNVVLEDGKPAAGATIVVVDRKRATNDELAKLAGDPAELRHRALVRTAADVKGTVRVPWRPLGVDVFGFTDERRGCIAIDANTLAPQRLELLPKIEVATQVVDEEGKPQEGVDVALFVHDENARLNPLQRATTGHDGLATIPDVDLELSLRSAAAGARPRFDVGFAFPLAPRVVVPLDLDAKREGPLVLTLPASGALAFQVVDENGDPVATAGTLSIVSALTRGAWKSSANAALDVKVTLDEKGSGSVPRFGLGLVGNANPDLPERKSKSVDFTGPTRSGETVSVVVPASAIGPVVVGHALDADGQALVAADLDASLDRFDVTKNGVYAGSTAASCKLDGDGAFRIDFSRTDRNRRDVALQLWLRAHRETEGEKPFVAESRVELELPELGVLDVGLVKFAPPARIAAGSVVDDDGTPVEDAVVVVSSDAKGLPPYRAFHNPAARSDPTGRFDMLGEIPDGQLSLRAMHAGFLRMKPVPIAAGASDVTLVLRIGGEADGSVLLPDGFANNFLKVRGTLGDVQQMQDVQADGTFRFPRLPTGPWTFELLLGRNDNIEKLLTANLVSVRPAEVAHDPRLQEIDLASLVHLIDVTVRVTGGDLASNGAVGRTWMEGNARRSLSIPLRDGHALVPCTTVPVPLQVVVPGFLAQMAMANDAPIDVLLHRGIPVRVAVRGGPAKFPDLVALRVTAIPRDDAIASVGPAPSAAVRDGEAALIVPSAGRYRAHIDFGPPPDPDAPPDEARRRDRRDRRDVDFDVKDVDGEQAVELKVKG